MSNPTDRPQNPRVCRHYEDMFGYCELRDSWALICNLCPYVDKDEHCPDYKPKEKKDGSN